MVYDYFSDGGQASLTKEALRDVRFSADEYTDYVNEATQLNCTVAGLLSDDIVIISRKKTASDNEQILSSSDVSKQPKAQFIRDTY
ncbi:hypothetical protein CHS0354_040951 [Potamilus streckersoni]|uniref:Uncharacterized protein n=1 Tax=Potamilus streckersoni TaxID=2493646 RepID=A0AAE0T7U5_9BIVA|nr:hypothetical protein CHS0354_040951 [Potamilus streckersoni]